LLVGFKKKEETVISYYEIVSNWGYEIVDWATFGDWSGDYVYILRKGDSLGVSVFGYGSCSGCDALDGLEGLQNFDELVKSLSDSMLSQVRWYANAPAAINHYNGKGSGADWWEFDNEIREWIIETLRNVESTS
jgi:hypothetical protein